MLKDFFNSFLNVRKAKIQKDILDFYLSSRDFNGIHSNVLCKKYLTDFTEEFEVFGEGEVQIRYVTGTVFSPESFGYKKLLKILMQLVCEERITVVYDLNPHIKRYLDASIENQLKFLATNFNEVGLYPCAKWLNELSPPGFENLPFKRKMLLGCPQVFPQYFELRALEHYAYDPRFSFDFTDYSGRASIKDEYDSSSFVLNRDKMFIERFGIGYKSSDSHRVAMLWVTDLANFTSEHQIRWSTYAIEENCKMDPDFYKNQVIGDWADNVGIYSAFIEEIRVINAICNRVGWPKLFKHEFQDDVPGFRIPFSSTSQNYLNFARLLDKMLSDNMNSKFFRRNLPEKERIEVIRNNETDQDEVIRLGTINLLDKFIQRNFRPTNDIDEMIQVFKTIRRLRSDESHRLLENRYHLDYEKMHDKLIDEAYDSLRLLRLILSNHPSVKNEIRDIVPDWLYEGKVRNFYFYSLDGISINLN